MPAEVQPRCPSCGRQEVEELIRDEPTQPYSSRIQQLLSTNQAPGTQEKIDLQTTLEEEIRQIDRLDGRIVSLMREVAGLFRTREEKKKKIEDYRTILHPIRYTPDDILREIFAASAAPTTFEETHHPQIGSLNQGAMHWVTSAVCSTWRSVSLSQPSLWSRIAITRSDFILPNNSVVTRPLLLSVQLNRSGSYPLSVSINSSSTISISHPLILALLPSFSRWRALTWCAPSESIISLSPLHGLTLSLEELTFFPISLNSVNDNPSQPIPPPTPYQLQWVLPRLKKISCGDSSWLPHLPIPHSQIEDFTGYVSSNSPGMLSTLPSLRRCAISLYRDRASIRFLAHAQSQLLMSHLHTLTITSPRETYYAPSWFSQIRLPSLQSLSVEHVCNPEGICKLIEHSPSLKTLAIRSSTMVDDECTDILQRQQNKNFLTTLLLHCPQVYTIRLIERLSNPVDPIVPSLRSLALIEHPYTEEQLSHLGATRMLAINE